MKTIKAFIVIASVTVFLMSPGAWAEEGDLVDEGLKLMGQKRYDDAIKAFSTAIEIIPRDYQAYNYRGVTWALKGNFDKAIADYDKALEIRPGYAEAFNNRGFAKTQQGNLRQALKDYTRAIEIKPFFVDAYNNKAWILATCSDRRLRDGGQAVRLAKKAVELKPDVASLDTLAAAYAAAGNFDAAIDTQKKVIQKLLLADKASEVPKYMAHLNSYKSGQSLLINYAAASKTSKTGNLKTSLKKQSKEKSLKAASKVSKTGNLKTSLKKQTKVKSLPPAKTHKTAGASKIKKPAAAPPAEIKSTPAIKPYPYTIQISSFRDAQKSKQVARKLITAGDPAFTSPVDIPGKGKWYRVYIGNYENLAEAKIAAAGLKKRKFRYVSITKRPYTVQIGPPVTRSEAKKLKSRLQAKGYLAYSLPTAGNPNQTRILIGAFASEQAAASLSKQLKKDGFSPKIGLK